MRDSVMEFRENVEVVPGTSVPVETAIESDSAAHEPSSKLVLDRAAWRGAFGEYREAMRQATEAADEFHFSTLLLRAGAALGRRVWFNYGMRLYPNFYVVNFGPTGDRKTTAQRRLESLGSGQVKTIAGAGSGEALADEFQGVAPGAPVVFNLEEFSELIRRGRWEGSTVLQFLTTCFDCPPKYELKFRKNPVCIEEPMPFLIAGTTPDWFWQSFRMADFHGGFGNRILFFTGARKDPIPLPYEPDLGAISEKVDALAHVESGAARLSAEAKQLWDSFYIDWDKAQRKRDQVVQVAVERMPAYVLKVGMVYSAFEGSLPEITRDQLVGAILVGEFCVKCAEELLSLQHAGTNPTKELERRMLAYVGKQPGRKTTKHLLYKALWRHYFDAIQFDRSFRALANAGELVAEQRERGTVLVSIP